MGWSRRPSAHSDAPNTTCPASYKNTCALRTLYKRPKTLCNTLWNTTASLWSEMKLGVTVSNGTGAAATGSASSGADCADLAAGASRLAKRSRRAASSAMSWALVFRVSFIAATVLRGSIHEGQKNGPRGRGGSAKAGGYLGLHSGRFGLGI